MDIDVCVCVAGFDVIDCEVILIPGGGEILLKLVDGEWGFVAGIMSREDTFEDKVSILLSAGVDTVVPVTFIH
jgi:hypothetical protein